MKRTSVAKQTVVYVKKNARLFMNRRDWKFIIIAAVISFLICFVVGEKMFTTYESTKSGFFTIISAAIWIGIFNSIQGVCKEHSTIRSEYRSGLHISAYVLAHVIFDFFVCLIQTMLLVAVCYCFIDFPQTGIIFKYAVIEYFITLFLVIWGADVLGITVSSLVSTPNAAMTAMPFVLIIQLIMSGVLFELSGISEKIAILTVSRWGMSALGSIGNLNSESLPLSLSLIYPNVERVSVNPEYDFVVGNLYQSWGNILLLTAVCVLVSIFGLKIRNKGS